MLFFGVCFFIIHEVKTLDNIGSNDIGRLLLAFGIGTISAFFHKLG